VLASGKDGWDEMCDEVSDGKICYGFCRFTINGVFRFVYLSWIGEGVQGMQAGAYNTHSNTMQRIFEGYHVQINGRNDADLWEDDVVARLTKAIGADYDAGEVNQGTKGNSGPSQPKKVVKTDEGNIDAEASAKFWAEQQASAPQSGYKKNLDFQKASGASSLKNRFEQLAEEQKPDAPAPRGPPKQIKLDTSSSPAFVESTPEPSTVSYDQNVGATYDSGSYEDAGGYEEGTGYDEGAYEESYEEAYEEEGYTEEAYAEEGYAEEGYAEEAYDEGYAQEGYAEEGYYEEGGELWATALYDYQGENEDDLSFYAGDSIAVLDQSDPSGWWKGSCNGVEGFFPSNFVELCQ